MRRLNYTEEEYKALTSAIYTFRSKQRFFTKEEFLSLLKSNNFSVQPNFFKLFITNHIIKKLDRFYYTFIPDSVYWKSIEQITKTYRKQLVEKNSKISIEDAIKLLKSNGYKIFKEV